MDNYIEQSVAAEKRPCKKFLKAIIWLSICYLVLISIIFGANAIKMGGEFSLNWSCVMLAALCLAMAFVLFRCKDRLDLEYDYVCTGKTLEICAIYGGRRRRKLLCIETDRILFAGIPDAALLERPDLKIHKWCVKSGRYGLCYMEKSIRHFALVDLNDDFAAFLRRHLPAGVWQDDKGR